MNKIITQKITETTDWPAIIRGGWTILVKEWLYEIRHGRLPRWSNLRFIKRKYEEVIMYRDPVTGNYTTEDTK